MYFELFSKHCNFSKKTQIQRVDPNTIQVAPIQCAKSSFFLRSTSTWTNFYPKMESQLTVWPEAEVEVVHQVDQCNPDNYTNSAKIQVAMGIKDLPDYTSNPLQNVKDHLRRASVARPIPLTHLRPPTRVSIEIPNFFFLILRSSDMNYIYFKII